MFPFSQILHGKKIAQCHFIHGEDMPISYAFNLFAVFSSLRIIFHRASAENKPTALSFRTLAYNIELGILLSREHLANCTFTTPVLGSRVKTGVARDVLRCCGDLSNWIEID